MKNLFAFFSLLLLLTFSGFSLPAQQFLRAYDLPDNLEAEDAATDVNGNHLMICTYFFGDIHLICTNPRGDTLWARSYGTNSLEYGHAVTELAGGGWALLGSTRLLGQPRRLWVTRLDTSGNVVWSRICGETDNLITPFGLDIKEGPNGDLWAVAQTPPSGSSINDMLAIRLDATGNVKWNRTVGGPSSEYGTCVIPTADGGVAVGGTFTLNSNNGMEAYAIKLDSTGVLEWTRLMGSSYPQLFRAGTLLPNGDLAFAGYFVGPNTAKRAGVVRMDAQGNPLWSYTYQNTPGLNDEAFSVEAFGNDLVVGGKHQTTAGHLPFLLVLDANGLPKTSKVLDPQPSMFAFSMQKGPDSLFTFTGNIRVGSNGHSAFLWVTDTTLGNLCDEVSLPLITDSLTLTSFSAGTSNPLSWDSLVTVTLQPVPVESSLICNNWGACNLTAHFSFANNDSSLCVGDSLILLNGTLSGNTYAWHQNDTLFSTAQNPTFYPPGTGSVEIRLVVSDSICTDSTLHTIEVFPIPEPDFTFQVNGGTVQFTDQSTGVMNWEWDFGDGNIDTTANPSHTYTSNGIYTVCLTITDSSGCSGTRCKGLEVNLVGIPERLPAEISIFPQPADDRIRIQGSEVKKVLVFDLMGKEVDLPENRIDREVRELDTSKLNAGIWLLGVETSSELFITRISIMRK